MEVDNVVEGSLMYMCVCVCVCAGESLPPSSNIAVLFCPAAPELISYRLLCRLCCWYVPVSALDWRKRFTCCSYFSRVSPVIPETDVTAQHITNKGVNRRISMFSWTESVSKWADSLSNSLKKQKKGKTAMKYCWNADNPVPGTSVLSERVFSTTGDDMSSQRSVLHPQHIDQGGVS